MTSVLPPRRALVAVAAPLLLVLAWQGGRMSARDDLAEDRSGVRPQADAADAAARDVGARDPDEVELLIAERDVALAAVARLEARLGEAERIAGDDAAELALYRRIESGAGTDGLSVESVAVVGAGTPDAALAVTLVQSRGRHRVTGTLGARLLDGPGDGTPVGEPAAFDLRFFQTVSLPLGAAAAALRDGSSSVELDVRPVGDRHDRFVEILPLDPILAERSGE